MFGTCRQLVAGMVLCAFALLAPAGRGQMATEAEEYQLKAAFLYKLSLHVQWSKMPGNDFVIGVLGNDPFGDHLDAIAREKKINGKTIVIRRFDTMTNYQQCQVLFISAEPAAGRKETVDDRLQEALKRVRNDPTLLVSDTPRFAQKGGMMNLSREESKIRIELNPDAAKPAGIQFGAKLLEISKIVAKEKD